MALVTPNPSIEGTSTIGLRLLAPRLMSNVRRHSCPARAKPTAKENTACTKAHATAAQYE